MASAYRCSGLAGALYACHDRAMERLGNRIPMWAFGLHGHGRSSECVVHRGANEVLHYWQFDRKSEPAQWLTWDGVCRLYMRRFMARRCARCKRREQWLPKKPREKRKSLSSWLKNERNKTDDHALSLFYKQREVYIRVKSPRVFSPSSCDAFGLQRRILGLHLWCEDLERREDI